MQIQLSGGDLVSLFKVIGCEKNLSEVIRLGYFVFFLFIFNIFSILKMKIMPV